MNNKKLKPLPGILLTLVVLAILAIVADLIARPWYLRWGTKDGETQMTLPGDELIPSGTSGYTRAITIQAPVENVWPWLLQMGADKAGLYSFTWLEGLVGCPITNADEIHPEWQNLKAGDVWPMCPKNSGPPPYIVAAIEPGKAIILGHHPAGDDSSWNDLWAFVLVPEDAATTRMIVRSRTKAPTAFDYVFELPIFIMERGMLLGIQERAERR